MPAYTAMAGRFRGIFNPGKKSVMLPITTGCRLSRRSLLAPVQLFFLASPLRRTGPTRTARRSHARNGTVSWHGADWGRSVENIFQRAARFILREASRQTNGKTRKVTSGKPQRLGPGACKCLDPEVKWNRSQMRALAPSPKQHRAGHPKQNPAGHPQQHPAGHLRTTSRSSPCPDSSAALSFLLLFQLLLFQSVWFFGLRVFF